MERVHELVMVPGRKSRLTITPTRVTVKVSMDYGVLAAEIYAAGLRIAEGITSDRSLRGCLDVSNGRVTLRTEARDLAMTYRFDGSLAEESA